jgi:HAD superfamily hydrolase (TIGR01484 family)
VFFNIFCYPDKVDESLEKLKKNPIFSNVIKLNKKHAIKAVMKESLLNTDDDKILEIAKKIKKIKTIRSVTPFADRVKDSKHKEITPQTNKLKHIFFDIDSTITHLPSPIIHRQVKDKFAKFTEKNVTVYFCTGRDKIQVEKLIVQFETSPYGIAEAGGIIINSNLPNGKFGDRTEPDKLLQYVQNKYKNVQIDEKQQSRMTEIVLKKETITPLQLKNAIKSSKANVEIHQSKNTYHITKKGINKGHAIHYVTGVDGLNLGEGHIIYSVGDSNLDIPMFDATDHSFAVENATKEAKKAASVCLQNSGPAGIDEIYDHMFGFS